MWVNGSGNVLARSLNGPYGEDLGLFHDQNFTGVGFASMPDQHQDAGVYYTPNRYLGMAGHFNSVDPSGSVNLRDPRTFNQYGYAVGEPLLCADPLGLDTILVLSGSSNTERGQDALASTGKAVQHNEQERIRQEHRHDRDQALAFQVITPWEINSYLSDHYASGPISKLILVLHGNATGVSTYVFEPGTRDNNGNLVTERISAPGAWIGSREAPFVFTTQNMTRNAHILLLSCEGAGDSAWDAKNTSFAAAVARITGKETTGIQGGKIQFHLYRSRRARLVPEGPGLEPGALLKSFNP